MQRIAVLQVPIYNPVVTELLVQQSEGGETSRLVGSNEMESGGTSPPVNPLSI